MALLERITHCYEHITPFQTAIAVSLLFLYILYLYLRDLGLPPGPKGLPLIGYWPFLEADTCHIHLQKLGEKYGDVLSIRVAGKLLIILGSIKSIKEAHIKKSEYFGGRFLDDSILAYLFRGGVTFINGDRWKVLRKFFLSNFKECGMNTIKENAASSVYDTMKETVEDLRASRGSPLQISDFITKKCIIIIQRIMFSDRGMTTVELEKLNDCFGEMTRVMTSTNLILIGNFAKYCMFPFMPSIQKFKKLNEQMEDIIFDVINQYKSVHDSPVGDLIDCYFKERDERKKKGDPTAEYFTDKALIISLCQFVTDGVQTIAILLGIFLLTLVEHPEEQDKIYEEIVEAIGTDRLPTLEDKTKLPYTNAFIYEVIRFTDFFPLAPSMQCTKETTVQGYKIPEGAITVMNLYAAHHNANEFENPDEFSPSRYLISSDEKRPELPVLFGVGKRSCIGEAFCMIQIYLFLTTIVQNFRLSVPEGSEGSSAMFWSKEKMEICFYPRSHKPFLKST